MYRLTGQLSLVFGILAALSVLKVAFLIIGLVFCLLGFATSIINIFIQTKYQMEKKVFTKAHLGLLLSSIPVIYIIIIVVIFKS
ncbi:MAG: hypothetical protein K0S33_1269 [Bacteroidetes bacterium]|nr:hypothetical protein [Bacteroidota bacterium]